MEKQKSVAAKKEEELKSVSRANENREKELKAEIDRLIDQSKKDKEERTKALEKSQQVILEIMIIKKLVSRSQTFRLTAEGLESMVAFIGQGPPMRPFDRHVKQPITVCFVQHHVSGRGNVATIPDRCVKLSDLF